MSETCDLTSKKCKPCEGGVAPLTRAEAGQLLKQTPEWAISDDGIRITRKWTVKNFVAAMEFFNKATEVAEKEGHHPDFHLVGYRNVTVELWTHAIGGLSENDFIVAAKIDQLPIKLRSA
ncbi:MAG: 4a-hydroxytetrahydrobiopterin dehydratase [Planctomycetota bacterium]|nr:4a-hydroxytetrahydrobiopterin dehydratase [Planctomycetota bacterium]MDA1140806.1 4a-hydroxytetrahydrobiopterin dehydratase [Planctomycetota bacterium]